jgi:predicted phage terminase large subunit-like protein
MTAGALHDEIEALEAEIARRDLHFFVEKTWHLVEPSVPFRSNWHVRKLCRVLEQVTRGELKRLIINVPPGTMKSLLVSVFWPAWEWASQPGLRYLTASYGPNLTIRDNLRCKTIVSSPWFQKHFKLEFKGDQNAKERFDTTAGGWRIATSVGGVGTGEHPDRTIIDDPITALQARSDAERSKANRWFDETISMRGAARDAVIIVIMQRLHMQDLTGHLLAKPGERWFHIKIPMRYEPYREKTESDEGNIPDPDDPRSTPGELLWPDLFPEHVVRTIEIDLNIYGTAGQLQQRPTPEGGGLFKREWFKFVDVAPKIARRARGWDTAATEATGVVNDGDWTASTKIAEADDLFYIEDVTHDQLSPAGVDALMLQTARADGIGCVQRELKEPAASGKTVIEARTKLLKGYDHAGVQVSHDKVTMAKPLRAQTEAGNVYLVRGPWNEAFIRECTNFPVGEHDDQVDSASCAFNAVLLEPRPLTSVTWGR